MNNLLYLSLKYSKKKLFLLCHTSGEVLKYFVIKIYINQHKLLEKNIPLLTFALK